MARGLSSLLFEAFASVLSPARCAACDSPVRLLAAFCPPCADTVERATGGDSGVLAAFGYGGAVARAIGRFKYERRPDLARPLGDLLWRSLETHADALAGSVVVPVPLHPARLAERGYNQAALLAARVARRLGAPMLARGIERVRDTSQQARLDREARIANVAGAFRVRVPGRVRERAVLLVDDVCTTGATLTACADALRDAQASSVTLAVVARAAPASRNGPDGAWPGELPPALAPAGTVPANASTRLLFAAGVSSPARSQ